MLVALRINLKSLIQHFKKMWHFQLLRKIVDPIPKKAAPSHPSPIPNKIIIGLLNGVFQEQ